ncbi:MAG: MFS transporter [Enterobacteriaceae bacterium]
MSEILTNIRPTPALSKPKTIAAITIGNGLEFYDFVVYSFFAKIIGELYFPADTETGQLLLSFATFGVGFLMRPLGGLFIGLYADKYGRKPAISLTLWLMGLSSLAFVITPTYDSIGIAAPIIILVARLVQGFAIGGEMGSSTAYLLEFASKTTRGFYTSWQGFSQGLSSLFASLVGVTLTGILTTEALHSWGWRIAFLIGVLIIPVGIYIRRKLTETAEVKPEQYKSSAALLSLFTHYKYAISASVLLMIGLTSATYIIIYYISNYGMIVLKLAPVYAILAASVASLMSVLLSPLAGWLSDKVGPARMILWTRLGLIVAAWPAFFLITSYTSLSTVLTIVALLSIPYAMTAPATMVLVTELLPKYIRATGFSIAYAIAIAIFGGFAQFFVTLLIEWTKSPNAPAFYLIVCGLLSLLGLMVARKSQQLEGVRED